jgi:hypothetical protein
LRSWWKKSFLLTFCIFDYGNFMDDFTCVFCVLSREGGCIIPHQKIFLKPSKYQIKRIIKNATPKYSINYKSVIT